MGAVYKLLDRGFDSVAHHSSQEEVDKLLGCSRSCGAAGSLLGGSCKLWLAPHSDGTKPPIQTTVGGEILTHCPDIIFVLAFLSGWGRARCPTTVGTSTLARLIETRRLVLLLRAA